MNDAGLERDVLSTPPPTLTPAQAESLAREHWGLDGTARPLGSERDQNFLIDAPGGRFVLKIANAAEDPVVTDLQTQILLHLEAVGPEIPVQRVRRTLAGAPTLTLAVEGERRRLRVVSHLPGETVAGAPRTPGLRRSLGNALGRLGRSLRGFYHPGAGHVLLWDLKHALRLRELLGHVDDAAQRRRIAALLDRFETDVAPALPLMRAQIIHNDFNRDNVLVDPADPERVTGILDFGDAAHSPLVIDLAVGAAYHVGTSGDLLEPITHMVSAYNEVNQLEYAEAELLFDLVMTRAVATAVIASWRAARYPENREYILRDRATAWARIELLDGVDREAAKRTLMSACGYESPRSAPASPASGGSGVLPRPAPEQGTDELLARRARDLGPAYRLFYDRPLHIVRGEGVWLYDADGRAYLDVYNNVPHVGHCHPRVVEAIARQAGVLNTHTRYLHELVLDYAERLAALFPPGLDLCMFACTGSEANELAMRLARSFTRGAGFICTEHAYHGNTSAVAEISPSDEPYPPVPHVRTVRAPDAYRWRAEGGAGDVTSHHLADLDAALASMRENGIAPAAFIVDSVFSSDGIVTVPPAWLAGAVERVRAAGGLFIGDEVQAGFGRTGEKLWGYDRYGVTPDIVTLGKPMANGHPVAAVVTRPEIAQAFAAQTHYFNTFGGNPVSCAAGLAVLDVLESERLQANARETGAWLMRGLEALAERHALIGDVRGSGFFIGVELVRDRTTLEPAAAATKLVVNGLRDRGVLVSTDGHRGNVLKLRPPMVFSKANADLLLERLDEVLAAL
jgi:4-aminobutyrate aminotransferase-like enzyme/Ser/Thr protein kinase RdoA (MazF antagonist)